MLNDADRYPFVVRDVEDALDRTRTIAFGAENGRVICSAPAWWKTNGTHLHEEAIGHAWAQAVRLARIQRGE